MICGFCGKAYEEDRSQPACKACPLGTDCGLILCPHCGYENPGMPRWITFVKELFHKMRGRSTPSEAPEAAAPPRGIPLPVISTPEHRS